MSTNEFLSRLTYEQLQYARERADKLIQAKREEKKLLIWRVESSYSCRGSFAESDYLAAVEFLCSEAKKAHEKGFRQPEDGRFEISYMRVLESEYHGYVDRPTEPAQREGE